MGTHFSDGYKTYLFDMAPDGKSIDRGSARLVNEGNGREANKLIKVGGWYYLVFSEHKPGIGRYVMARRSRKVTGPYKEEKQLALPGVEAIPIRAASWKGATVKAKHIWLRTRWGLDGLSHYSYSLDGDRFLPFGEPYQMVWGNYKGDRVGIYCFNDNGEAGHVDVDYLHYR